MKGLLGFVLGCLCLIGASVWLTLVVVQTAAEQPQHERTLTHHVEQSPEPHQGRSAAKGGA